MCSLLIMRARILAPALSCALVTFLVGCSGAGDPVPASEGLIAKVGGVTPPLVDVTAEVRDAAGEVVTLAEIDGAWLVVRTTVVDPSGDYGSAEPVLALEVCEKAVALGYKQVRVTEADGTTLVHAGHPAYGADCVELS